MLDFTKVLNSLCVEHRRVVEVRGVDGDVDGEELVEDGDVGQGEVERRTLVVLADLGGEGRRVNPGKRRTKRLFKQGSEDGEQFYFLSIDEKRVQKIRHIDSIIQKKIMYRLMFSPTSYDDPGKKHIPFI